MSGTMFGRYRMIRELGRGAMAVVYLAEDTTLMRQVAVKSLSPQYAADSSFRERFQREARILARVRHESIIPIFDFGSENDVPYIVMEYMPGGTLAERIESDSLTIESSLEVLRRIASALDAAHAAGVIHRDLKPANILFDGGDRAFVGDFGVGRLDGSSSGVTLPGTVIGTAQYMAPEQVNGAPPTAAADIYSYGALAYETLVRRPPFTGGTVWEIMRQHLEDRPVPPSRINPALAFADEPILAALEKDPAKRPPDARTVSNALDTGYQRQDAPVAPPAVQQPAAPPRPQPPAAHRATTPPSRSPSLAGARPPRRRGPTLVAATAAGAVIAAGIAVALTLLLRDDGGTRPATPTATAEATTPAGATSPPGNTPTSATRTVVPGGHVVVFDDFADAGASRFPQVEGQSGHGFIGDGAYGIIDASDDDDLYLAIPLDTGAVHHAFGIDAFAPPGGRIIITCRGDDRFEVRLLVRQAEREFRLELLDKRVPEIKALTDWTESEAIHPDEGNRLQLVCFGDSVIAAVNNVFLAEHSIIGIEGTTISFGADGGVQGTFDNAEVRIQ